MDAKAEGGGSSAVKGWGQPPPPQKKKKPPMERGGAWLPGSVLNNVLNVSTVHSMFCGGIRLSQCYFLSGPGTVFARTKIDMFVQATKLLMISTPPFRNRVAQVSTPEAKFGGEGVPTLPVCYKSKMCCNRAMLI
eukprot:jgi/Botrbrau1/5012/Bobra.0396s0033.1